MLEPLPRIVGSVLVDKVGPLLAGLLLAGRIAASVSAEIGGKRLSRQFDRLERDQSILIETLALYLRHYLTLALPVPEHQQDALRALNEGALMTYLGDRRRYEEPLRLIHGWCGNENALQPNPIFLAALGDAVARMETLKDRAGIVL